MERKEFFEIVEKAMQLIEKENLNWIDAIEKAKGTSIDLDNGEIYTVDTGEIVGDL